MAATSHPLQEAKIVGDRDVVALLDVVSGDGVMERQRAKSALARRRERLPARSLKCIPATFDPPAPAVIVDQGPSRSTTKLRPHC